MRTVIFELMEREQAPIVVIGNPSTININPTMEAILERGIDIHIVQPEDMEGEYNQLSAADELKKLNVFPHTMDKIVARQTYHNRFERRQMKKKKRK